jgi:succinyl-CoA synthetase beta subunit
MNIHEYQAKALLARFGVAVPRGRPAFSVDEAVSAAEALGGKIWVVKAQIHAGGRGKAGGVKVAKSTGEVRKLAGGLLGTTLVTKQTGPAGRLVRRLYIEEGIDIARELYLGLLIDRATSRITAIASTEGGTEIEEVAAATPERIIKVSIDPATGLMPHHARRIAYALGLEGDQVRKATRFLEAIYRAFVELDASVVELNPLIVTGAGDVMALDAKMNFDDNALWRHKDVAELRDEDEEDPTEREAAAHELNYVKLEAISAAW